MSPHWHAQPGERSLGAAPTAFPRWLLPWPGTATAQAQAMGAVMRKTKNNDVDDDWTVRQRTLDFAKQTYAEVLDATKHQDDKVGRYLAALAFLTTGAIALLFRSGILARDFRFEGDFPVEVSAPLIALSALGFFGCVLLSVALLLLCLSTPLRVPGQRREHAPSGNPLGKSRLFFSYIGGQPVKDWKKRWELPPEQIQQELTRQYIAESHNLAERARSKYQHTNEAAALFVFALVFLGLAVALIVLISLQAGGPIVVGREVSIIVAFVAAIYSGALLHSQLVYERQSMQYFVDGSRGANDEAVNRRAAGRALAIMVYAVPAALVIAAIPEDDRLTRGAFWLASVIFILWSFRVTKPRWKTTCPGCKLRVRLLLVGALVVATGGFSLGGPFQLGMLLVYPCFLFASSVRDGSRRHRVSQYRLLDTRPPGHSRGCHVYDSEDGAPPVE